MTTERITGDEVRERSWVREFNGTGVYLMQPVPPAYLDRLAAQLDADAANAGDAAQWRALKKIQGHTMRARDEEFGFFETEGVHCWTIERPDGMVSRVAAPTPVELLAKLDALAEAAKPKEERWRWRHDSGEVSAHHFPNPQQARSLANYSSWTGHPVREVVRPDGVIELHPEGT